MDTQLPGPRLAAPANRAALAALLPCKRGGGRGADATFSGKLSTGWLLLPRRDPRLGAQGLLEPVLGLLHSPRWQLPAGSPRSPRVKASMLSCGTSASFGFSVRPAGAGLSSLSRRACSSSVSSSETSPMRTFDISNPGTADRNSCTLALTSASIAAALGGRRKPMAGTPDWPRSGVLDRELQSLPWQPRAWRMSSGSRRWLPRSGAEALREPRTWEAQAS
mmetsp:Transcript_132144/g.232880  ORF Transcript_132144/g.232880 Transcript_132144/m.232880 type:complete len:221 (+) Transcript_132144:586-1248(+)